MTCSWDEWSKWDCCFNLSHVLNCLCPSSQNIQHKEPSNRELCRFGKETRLTTTGEPKYTMNSCSALMLVSNIYKPLKKRQIWYVLVSALQWMRYVCQFRLWKHVAMAATYNRRTIPLQFKLAANPLNLNRQDMSKASAGTKLVAPPSGQVWYHT